MDRSFITRNLTLYYIIFWVAIASVQFVLIYGVYSQDILVAIADSLISYCVFALLGVGLWYMIRFSGKQLKGFGKILLYHLTGCAFTIFIWQAVVNILLRFFFGNDDVYMNFMFTSLIIRILTGVLLYFLLISIDFLLLNLEEMQEQSEHEAELSALLREAELSMLRSQIRPHFLFNSLNSVSALTLSNPQAAQNMILKLSEYMRYSIGQGADTMNTLTEELYHAGLYLDIEKVRFSDRIDIQKDIDSNCGEMMIPSMILQPLLENAVKHGVNTMLTTCIIALKASCHNSFLELSIKNSYDPDSVPRKGTGTGLVNVKKRLSTIYGRNDLILIKSNNEEFEITLRIPTL